MNEQQEHLETYLQMVAQMSNGRSVEAVVWANGKAYEPPIKARPFGVSKGRNGYCFMNAYQLAASRNWQYVEGFAISIIPTEHAWVIDNRGNVVETTWQNPGLAYYGIPLGMDFLLDVQRETQKYGALTMTSRIFRKKFNLE